MADAIYAEYREASELAAAVHLLCDHGYRGLETYTAYPAGDVVEALERIERGSRLPWLVFVVGMAAAAAAFTLQWWLVAYLYPLDVGGRPPFMPLPFVIITFEMGILFAGFAAFFGALGKARLGRLWDEVFEVDGFERTSIDRHWLRVSADDPLFSASRVERLLRESGAGRVIRQTRTP